ncbi:hypothetical protein EU546_03460 [Candidatus Thorarchaeota archaeon]|nr:MAG: hypothetical protein EU546_03460 [Candidatus Thorarchaeota archaeon]
MTETGNLARTDEASSQPPESGWKEELKSLRQAQVVWGVILVGIAVGLFVPAFLLTLGGIIVYLWIIPLAVVPVIVFQILAICIAAMFASTSSKTIVDRFRPSGDGSEDSGLSYTDHLLRTSVFVMALLGSPLYLWNVFSLVLGTVLAWKGKNRGWQVMGFVAIVGAMLVQIYIFTSLWR